VRRTNPRKQGEIGLGAAIAHFTAAGWSVSIPLADNQPYDLVVDDGAALHRVQVKTTTCRSPRGSFVVSLETAGRNRSRLTRTPFDHTAAELLFVLTDDGERYLIPTTAFRCTTKLTLGEQYAAHRVPDRAPGPEHGDDGGGRRIRTFEG
jgi:hypothetical protein